MLDTISHSKIKKSDKSIYTFGENIKQHNHFDHQFVILNEYKGVYTKCFRNSISMYEAQKNLSMYTPGYMYNVHSKPVYNG